MTPTAKIYLKVILTYTVMFGIVLMFPFVYRFKEFSFDLFFLFLIFLFGITVGGYAVEKHLNSLRKIGVTNFNSENIGVKHFRKLTSNISQEGVLDLIKSDDYFDKHSLTSSGNKIHMKPKNILSIINSRIEITIAALKDDIYQYQIKVEPKLKTIFVDNGESLKITMHLEKIIKTLPNMK